MITNDVDPILNRPLPIMTAFEILESCRFEKLGNDLVAIKNFDEQYLIGNSDGTLEWTRQGGNNKFFKMILKNEGDSTVNKIDDPVAFQCVQYNTFLFFNDANNLALTTKPSYTRLSSFEFKAAPT